MTRRAPCSGSRQRGIALLVVLWGCTLAAITLGALATSARVDGLQAQAQSRRAVALQAAEGGIAEAVYRLRVKDGAQRWREDGAIHRLRQGRTEVAVVLHDEGGKINLNRARPERIEALLRATGLPADQARSSRDAIVAWGSRDTVADALLARGGFSSLEELWRVPGLDSEVVARLLPSLTLWTADDDPNLAHAPLPVLMAVTGADETSASLYLNAIRALPDTPMPPMPPLPGTRTGRTALTDGDTVTIVSSASAGGGITVTLTVTLALNSVADDPKAFRTLRWREAGSDAQALR